MSACGFRIVNYWTRIWCTTCQNCEHIVKKEVLFTGCRLCMIRVSVHLGPGLMFNCMFPDLACTVQGSNNVAPTISRTSGVPSPVQDGLALTEKQVTRLMEDDMGSAMQYLQSKGLCLMPIALATAISTTNSRGATAGVGDRQRTTVAASNGGLVTDGLVIEQSSKDNIRDIESAHTTTSMPINKAPKGEGKPSDGP